MRRLSCAVLFVLATARGAAQEPFQVSPIISFDFGSPLFINRGAGVFNHSTSVDSGTSSSISYGIGAESGLQLIGPVRLFGRLEGIYSAGEFTGRDTISGHEWKLLAEAMAELRLFPILLRAGPWLSSRLSGTIFPNEASSTQSNTIHTGVTAGIAWEIKDFLLRPELNTHLDLTELSQAGSNAWSIGISLAYKFGDASHALAVPKPDQTKVLLTSPAPTTVKFLVNGSPSQGTPPLERVETRIKEYRMVDSANVPPRVSQWDEESYHLPRIGLACNFPGSNGGDLMLFKDNLRLLEKTFARTNSTTGIDTVLDLDNDSAWQNILALMNTGENNRLIAELRTNSETARDTLVLPPADTSRAGKTVVRQEFRFELSDNYDNYKGGTQSLDLLLKRMKELLDSINTIQIQEGVNERNLPGHTAIKKKLESTLGNRWEEFDRMAVARANEGWIVVMER